MNATITGGSAVIAPTIVLGISDETPAGNVIHEILGRRDPDVTLRAPGRRKGVLELGFSGADSEAKSHAARNILLLAGLLTLVAPERTTFNGMTFVVTDNVARVLDPETRNAWTLTVPYQEVSP